MSRTASAQWAGRSSHTSVIDAAGAIYVIGGYNGGHLQDVWVSTDGGADRDSVKGWSGSAPGGYSRGVLAGTIGYHGGTKG
jgi:hypothetical protein